jgi:hypothetical protein
MNTNFHSAGKAQPKIDSNPPLRPSQEGIHSSFPSNGGVQGWVLSIAGISCSKKRDERLKDSERQTWKPFLF